MSKVEIQLNNKNTDTKDVEKLVKGELKANNIKLNSLADLQIYYKPESNDVFYKATSKDGKIYINNDALKLA